MDSLEIVVDALRQLTRKSQIMQGANLIDRLVRDTRLDAATIRGCFKDIKARGWIEASSWSGTGNPIGRVQVNLPPLPPPSWAEGWSGALVACKRLSKADQEALSSCGACLADMDIALYPQILEGLVRLRDDQDGLVGRPAFLVSANYLLGSSKLLGKLGARAIKAFGVDISRFSENPQYVITAGSANPHAVVLIENPVAFELAATTSAIERCAFISTFGFGLSKTTEDFGYQLAGMVETGFSNAVTLVREGSSTPTARELLKHPNITFWGDLDIAGMQIFERIATWLPEVRLSALYGPMIDAVSTDANRHPYVSAAGKSGQSMFHPIRNDAVAMLNHCCKWAADQELVTEKQISQLAGKELDVRRLQVESTQAVHPTVLSGVRSPPGIAPERPR